MLLYTTEHLHSVVASPEIFWGAKMFDFRRITLFCLEKRFSKHKMSIFSKNLGEAMAPLAPPGYAYASPSRNFSHLLQNLMLKCLHFFPLSDYSLMISGSDRYSWCAVSVFGIPMCS